MKHLNLYENIFDNVPINPDPKTEGYWELVLAELKNITKIKDIHVENLDIGYEDQFFDVNFLFSAGNNTYQAYFDKQPNNKFVLEINDYPNARDQNKLYDVKLSNDPKITAAVLSIFID